MQCCSRLLIEAHRGIELQATGVDRLSLSLHSRLSPLSLAQSLTLIYHSLPFPPHSLSLSLSRSRLSLSAVFGPELSEFHFRPITIHPRFKAAVTPRSFRKRAAIRSNHFFSLHFVSLRLFNRVTLRPSPSSGRLLTDQKINHRCLCFKLISHYIIFIIILLK